MSKDKVLELIRNAQDGKLSLEELNRDWPEGLDGNPLFEEIYDHIEAAVEHYPSSLFTNESYHERFKASSEYKALIKDSDRLTMK